MPIDMGLRERNKAKRRDAILDAALHLLRRNQIGSVSMERIAEAAEVAPATVYNLVGTREQLLVALVDRVIDDLVDVLAARAAGDGPLDPIETAELIVTRSARAFTAESAAYRQVVGALGNFSGTGASLAFDPSQLQVAAMREAQAAGILRKDVDPATVGRQIYVAYNGAIFTWASGMLDDRGFVLSAQHGMYSTVVAFAADRHRRSLLRRLDDLHQQLSEEAWRRRG